MVQGYVKVDMVINVPDDFPDMSAEEQQRAIFDALETGYVDTVLTPHNNEWFKGLKRQLMGEELSDSRDKKGRGESLLEEYRDALIAIDELSIHLGKALKFTRVGWNDGVTCDGVLAPINQVAGRIGEVIPNSIKVTRRRSA